MNETKKYGSYKSCPISRLKNMPKSKSWRCPAKEYVPCRQTSLKSMQKVRKRFQHSDNRVL